MRRLTGYGRRLPIRLKLTAAFVVAMAVIFTALGVFLYFRFEAGLDTALNQQLRARASEIASLARAANLGTRPLRERGESYAQLLNADGRVIDASAGLNQPLLSAREAREASRRPILIQRKESTRLYAMPTDGGADVVVVGASLGEHESALEELGAALLIGGPFALAVASVAGYLLAAAALRPVESMRRRAATISSEETGARLPLPESVDEIYRLGGTLNEMLARLQEGLERERAFVADASHELRSPLAVLKAELEVALLQEDLPEQVRAAVASAVEETDRVIALAENLLVLARGERGQLAGGGRLVAADGLLTAVAARYREAAYRSGRTLTVAADGDAWVDGDEVRLQQAVSNLVENALRYGEGPVELSSSAVDGRVELHVRDRGGGFPPDFLPHAFDRFTRADHARRRGGAGLGLAIVQAVAQAHNGFASATTRPQGGADVWITLARVEAPRADADRSAALGLPGR